MEFVFNNVINVFIKVISFFMNYGFYFKFMFMAAVLSLVIVSMVVEFLIKRIQVQEQVR